jgi:hypothetical protein
MDSIKNITATLAAAVMLVGVAQAGGHKTLGNYSGFEGKEDILGAAVVKAINEASEEIGASNDFSEMEYEVGLYSSKMIKTLVSNSAYQHEMSDALVKMTLEFMQYAKDQGKLEEVARADAMTQFPMLKRVATMIEKSGKKDDALIAITDQTACFYQLVGKTERGPGYVRYRAPYGLVLASTTRLGMHDLTEQEIHEQWTVPHIEIWSELMGVEIAISNWQEDGMITISIPEITEAMAANVE